MCSSLPQAFLKSRFLSTVYSRKIRLSAVLLRILPASAHCPVSKPSLCLRCLLQQQPAFRSPNLYLLFSCCVSNYNKCNCFKHTHTHTHIYYLTMSMGQKSGQDLTGALLRFQVAMKVSLGTHSHLETPLEKNLLPSSLGLWAESSSQMASDGDGPSADCLSAADCC